MGRDDRTVETAILSTGRSTRGRCIPRRAPPHPLLGIGRRKELPTPGRRVRMRDERDGSGERVVFQRIFAGVNNGKQTVRGSSRNHCDPALLEHRIHGGYGVSKIRSARNLPSPTVFSLLFSAGGRGALRGLVNRMVSMIVAGALGGTNLGRAAWAGNPPKGGFCRTGEK